MRDLNPNQTTATTVPLSLTEGERYVFVAAGQDAQACYVQVQFSIDGTNWYNFPQVESKNSEVIYFEFTAPTKYTRFIVRADADDTVPLTPPTIHYKPSLVISETRH